MEGGSVFGRFIGEEGLGRWTDEWIMWAEKGEELGRRKGR